EVLEKLSHVVPNAGFRTKLGYCDAAYVAAAAVIPKVTGKSWEQYLKESILVPLGMTSTFTSSLQVAKAANKAAAHVFSDGMLSVIDYPRLDNIAPATGISSSVQDMGKWVKALLEEGKAGNSQVIPAAAIRSTMSAQMYSDTYKRTTGEMCINLYALGWFYQIYAGKVLILLDDVGSGFTSIVNLVPEQKLGIIVLTNSQTNFFHEALALEILDVYMKRPYQDYSSKFAPEMKSQNEQESQYLTEQKINAELRDSVALKRKPELNLNNYTGRYSNDLYGNMTITQENNNNLVMRFEHHPHLSVKLQPLGGNRFYGVYSDPFFGKAVFPFEVSEGKVTNVSVSSAIDSMTYSFKKL
ncbi:MAG: serine hydrolase, partial [Hymenobacter sp.]